MFRTSFPSISWFLPLLIVLTLPFGGCGGDHILGAILTPPALPSAIAAKVTDASPVPADDSPLCTPVAVRLYPTGEIIVDVLFVTSVGASQFEAQYHTNGFNVPAHRSSGAREDTFILIQNLQGKLIRPTRAILGEPAFMENHPYLHASTTPATPLRTTTINRAGRYYRVYFVPILLSPDDGVRLGEQVDVRIKPRSSRQYDIDDRWHRVTVEPFVADAPK